tara:strand:- start:4222 stop:5025 length:804 start_codon:yes stop_codon:yes gene_type:complete
MKIWTATAFNTAPDSENQIHGDELAKKYGFEGGLVPGTTISAYLAHPIIEFWGKDWLDRGYANFYITSPLYDNEKFKVVTKQQRENHFNTNLIRENGVCSANAEMSLPKVIPEPPILRKDDFAKSDFLAPIATKEVWENLKDNGCRAFKYNWEINNPLIYLKDPNLMPEILQPNKGGYSNLCFLLGCSNWVLAGNGYMNPWVHLSTSSQNYKAVPMGTNLITEMEINRVFEKKGHEFIDVNVNLFDENDASCVMSINLVAIYKLRGA